MDFRLTDARGLLLAITTTDFISALVITNSCLKYLQALTSNLQAEAKDIVAAVDSVLSTLQDVRDNISTHHASWYNSGRNVLRHMYRTIYTQKVWMTSNRSNIPADTPSKYYCRCISIPLLDHLLSEMQSRFTIHHQTALLGLTIVLSVLVKLSDEKFSTIRF